jgi:hypothetical protein
MKITRLVNQIKGFISKPPCYVNSAPCAQNILDMFVGNWLSKIPQEYNLQVSPGSSNLYEDPRILWLESLLEQGFKNKNILELGPFEAGHSYMLSKKFAQQIDSIESNYTCFQKCLAAKEIFSLTNVNFMLGDFVKFLQKTSKQYDLIVASGVLYHMLHPLELIDLLQQKTDRLFIWTHYYDQEVIAEKFSHFSKVKTYTYNNFSYKASLQNYGIAKTLKAFNGGQDKSSLWLTRSSLLDFLENKLGYNVKINFETKDHKAGPAFALYCSR